MKNAEGKLEKEKEENILKRKNIFAEKEKENIFGEGKYFFSRGYFAETLKEVSTDGFGDDFGNENKTKYPAV